MKFNLEMNVTNYDALGKVGVYGKKNDLSYIYNLR